MLPEQQQRIMGYFIEEAKDHLNTIEQGLLNLQNTLKDSEMLNEVFRAAHSVKGGAAMLGIDSIQRTAHRLEDCFKVLKECPIQVDQKLESLFLRVFDTLQGLLEHLQGPFGLREEVTTNLMSEVEPVFEALNQHLGLLVSQAGGDVQLLEPVPVPSNIVPEVPHHVPATETTFLPVFQSQVLEQLRRMLQLFKQAETQESRAQLQECCHQLFQLGRRFNLLSWSNLCQKAASAIANSVNSYRTLAPTVIKEIKQSQELVLAGREAEIATSQELEALLPAMATAEGKRKGDRRSGVQTQDPLRVTASSRPSIVPSPHTWDEVLQPEWSLERTGPMVGMAELNSLADLFEAEAPDLDETWQQEETIENGSTAGTHSSSGDDDADNSDLLEFLLEENTAAPSAPLTNTTTAEDLTLLFGSFLEEEYPDQNSLATETPTANALAKDTTNSEDDHASMAIAEPETITVPSPVTINAAVEAVPVAAADVTVFDEDDLSDLFALEDNNEQPSIPIAPQSQRRLQSPPPPHPATPPSQSKELTFDDLFGEVATTSLPLNSEASDFDDLFDIAPVDDPASPILKPNIPNSEAEDTELLSFWDEVQQPDVDRMHLGAKTEAAKGDTRAEGERVEETLTLSSPSHSQDLVEQELAAVEEDWFATSSPPASKREEFPVPAANKHEQVGATLPPAAPAEATPEIEFFNLGEPDDEMDLLFEDIANEPAQTPVTKASDRPSAENFREQPASRHEELAALFNLEISEAVDIEGLEEPEETQQTEIEALDFETLGSNLDGDQTLEFDSIAAVDAAADDWSQFDLPTAWELSVDEGIPVEPAAMTAQLNTQIGVDEDSFDWEPDLTTATLDDFTELEAILADEVPERVTAANASESIDDEFAELEKLLDADQTSSKSNQAQTASNRRRRTAFEQTMRVPVKYLDNLSNLVGELVVNRNSLEQDQERMRQFLDNLLHQVHQLSDAGSRMQELYERSLLEASLLASRKGNQFNPQEVPDERTGTRLGLGELELDSFTPFHSLSQEMIELIVRVRESAADIGFVTDETEQVARQFRQVTSQLQEGLTRTRMVPFAQIADRLPRAVRDIAIRCGKQAELKIIDEGRDTLIDKVILEQLYDPMTHLVNNAITHGIELPQERIAKGKSPVGLVTIRAFHQGNQTVISVADDGAGIVPEQVKAKAIQKGLMTPSEAKTMSRLEVYDLLFRPGFTTKDRADDFCGRGIGMDVVRTSLSEMRGVINTDSAPGKGTTFTIRLPLTLSICKALCCLSDRARIAFPMDGVEDAIDVPANNIQVNDAGLSCISWRDSLVPFKPLKELLVYNRQLSRGNVYGGNREDDTISIVVLRSAGNFIALQVDQVLGEQEIVIKQFEDPAPKPIGVAGATVLGDGRIMPIADVLELIDLFHGGLRSDVGGYMWGDQNNAPVPPETPVVVKSEPTVLIVDDSITVRELLSLTFNKAGYRVEQARDGQEAWDKLRSGLPCDIVFCDIEMPRCDGLELLSRIQKDPSLQHLPIAMLTSRGADRHRQMAIQLGASGYFTKPYLEEALLDAAGRMLRGEVLVTANVKE